MRVLGGSVGPGVDYHPIIGADGAVPPRNILIDGVLFHDWRPQQVTSVHTECLQIGAGDGIVIRGTDSCDAMSWACTSATGGSSR